MKKVDTHWLTRRYTRRGMTPLGAGIILCDGDHYLLLQGAQTGIWSFPKGHSEETDHDLMDTAIRETYEETGYIHGKDYQIVGNPVRLDKRTYWNAIPLRILRNPLLSDEHWRWRWANKTDMEWLQVNNGVRDFMHQLRS